MKFLTLCIIKKSKRGAKTSNFKNTISKTPEKLSLVTLVTTYHKLSLSLAVIADKNFLKRSVLNFESFYIYFK